MAQAVYWTHPSVIQLAGDRDPIEVITERAQEVVFKAFDSGWSGPPFDPFELAQLLKITVIAREEINDACTVPIKNNRLQIEYNPNRPGARVRFSVAHEVAHTFFPDCRERVRNRQARHHMKGDDWQLEMLCNIGAAELLMPIGSFPELRSESLSIDHLLKLRAEFEVSTEAILLRLGKLTRGVCSVFAASCQEKSPLGDQYQLDYEIPSGDWSSGISAGELLPLDSVVGECKAIGYTAKGNEVWGKGTEPMHIECVGVSPFPERHLPRVVGILVPSRKRDQLEDNIEYLKGDATEPRGSGNRIIAHIVNDGAARWGAGFARVVGKKWPHIQKDFVERVGKNRRNLKLGKTYIANIDHDTSIVHMIAQRGYGPSKTSRIRYHELEQCLIQLGDMALERDASVHMPRIGCGQAGGRWEVVSELIEDALCQRGVLVTVYDIPTQRKKKSVGQRSLFS